ARSCATYAARSSALARAGERPSHAEKCARSRRYASTVRGARRAAASARKPSTAGSGRFVMSQAFGSTGGTPSRNDLVTLCHLEENVTRKRVVVHGFVQGVGFRYAV